MTDDQLADDVTLHVTGAYYDDPSPQEPRPLTTCKALALLLAAILGVVAFLAIVVGSCALILYG